jgi:hypothetical protein
MVIDWLMSKEADVEDGRIASFGDVTSEYQALESAIVVPLLGHTALRVTGDDRHDFVHGQLTHEVNRLNVNSFSENLMLNHKGHALAQMRVFRREGDLFIAVEGGAGALVEHELRAHIVFDQVELQNLSSAITSFTVQGKTASRVIGNLEMPLPADNGFTQIPFADAKILLHPAKRTVYGGFDIHVLSRDAESLARYLLEQGATLAGEKALTISRIEAGIPLAETEAGDGVLPQEAGLEPLVSYAKGCYLGQEIMARIEARGNLRRMLKGLLLSSMPDSRGIFLDSKNVGQLGAVAHHPSLGVIALAVLRNDIDPDAALKVSGVEARVTELPFDSFAIQ